MVSKGVCVCTTPSGGGGGATRLCANDLTPLPGTASALTPVCIHAYRTPSNGADGHSRRATVAPRCCRARQARGAVVSLKSRSAIPRAVHAVGSAGDGGRAVG